MSLFYLMTVAILGLARGVVAETVFYDFEVGWVNAAPDGFSRPVIGINGQWPIPIIEVNVGDTVVVNVVNALGNESTSLHFHGQYQGGTANSDGTAGVTQCPIYPGDSYTYTFSAYPAGTHWYHSHVKGQYADGLRGLMIIHDVEWEESLEVDKQIYLSVSDWWHEEQPTLIEQYMSPENRDGDLASPDSMLVNDTRHGPDLEIEPGKRHLLRIANVGGLACSHFHIDGHVLSVVALDGSPIQPVNTDTIVICAGQRYDIIITGREDIPVSSYIVKMTTDMMTKDIPSEFSRVVIGSALSSSSSATRKNQTIQTLTTSWDPKFILNDFALSALDETTVFGPVDRHIYLRSNQTYYEGIGTRTALGVYPWVSPKVPSLYTALTTGGDACEVLTYGVGVDPWVLERDDVVQIYMENPDPWPHPMHLHGHRFQLIKRGGLPFDGDETGFSETPAMRDTVVIPPEGYIILRFIADNPGVWLFHCHIDLHMIGGMASTFIEAPGELQSQQYIPEGSVDVCQTSGDFFTGNCMGEFGPVSLEDSVKVCNTIFNVGRGRGKGNGGFSALVDGRRNKEVLKDVDTEESEDEEDKWDWDYEWGHEWD